MLGNLIEICGLGALGPIAHAAPLPSPSLLDDKKTISEVNGLKDAGASASVSRMGVDPLHGSGSAFAEVDLPTGELKARAAGSFRCLDVSKEVKLLKRNTGVFLAGGARCRSPLPRR